MNSLARFFIGLLCLLVIFIAATNIGQTAHQVPWPTSPDVHSVIAYAQALLLHPTETDKVALIEIAVCAMVLILMTASRSTYKVEQVTQSTSVAKEFIDAMLPKLQAMEDRHGKIQPLKSKLEAINRRIDTIEHDETGLDATYRAVDVLSKEVESRIESIEQDDDEDGAIIDRVDELLENSKDVTRRVGEAEQVHANLSVMKTSLDVLVSSVKTLDHPQTGTLATIRLIHDMMEPLWGDNGSIAVMLKGDSRYDGDLAKQVEEMQESLNQLTAALATINRSNEVAQHTKREMARLASPGENRTA